jgi:hypothetical protein
MFNGVSSPAKSILAGKNWEVPSRVILFFWSTDVAKMNNSTLTNTKIPQAGTVNFFIKRKCLRVKHTKSLFSIKATGFIYLSCFVFMLKGWRPTFGCAFL